MEGLLVAGGVIALTILASFFLGDDRGSVAGLSAGALVSLLIISWPLHKERWFWATFAVFVALNAFGVAYFDWSFTHDWNGHSFASLMLPDLGVMMGIIYGIYCLIYGTPSKAVADPPDEGPSYSERDLDL